MNHSAPDDEKAGPARFTPEMFCRHGIFCKRMKSFRAFFSRAKESPSAEDYGDGFGAGSF